MAILTNCVSGCGGSGAILPPLSDSADKCTTGAVIFNVCKIIVGSCDEDSALTDWTDAAEWAAKLSQTDVTDASFLRILKGEVALNEPDVQEIELTCGDKQYGDKTHTATVTVDRICDEMTDEFLNALNCINKVRIFLCSDEFIFGYPNEGIIANISVKRSGAYGEAYKATIEMSWTNKYDLCKTPNVLP